MLGTNIPKGPTDVRLDTGDSRRLLNDTLGIIGRDSAHDLRIRDGRV